MVSLSKQPLLFSLHQPLNTVDRKIECFFMTHEFSCYTQRYAYSETQTIVEQEYDIYAILFVFYVVKQAHTFTIFLHYSYIGVTVLNFLSCLTFKRLRGSKRMIKQKTEYDNYWFNCQIFVRLLDFYLILLIVHLQSLHFCKNQIKIKKA